MTNRMDGSLSSKNEMKRTQKKATQKHALSYWMGAAIINSSICDQGTRIESGYLFVFN